MRVLIGGDNLCGSLTALYLSAQGREVSNERFVYKIVVEDLPV